MVRARMSARMRSSPWRRSAASRLPTSRSTGTNSPSGRSAAMPTSIFLSTWRRPVWPSYQAFRPGSARQPATSARTRRMVTSAPACQAWISASSITVAAATSFCARAMFCAIARRTPRSSSGAPSSASVAATRSTSAAVTVPSGPDAVAIARSTPRRRASARTAGVALTRAAMPAAGAAAPGGAASLATRVPTCTEPTTVPASASSPAPSKPTSGAPRWTISPGCACSLAMVPA
ncbi:hypothetical protein D9M70_469940 [compost metagenome]